MQILAISKPQNVEEARLLHNHRELRARIFSDRLGWDVHVVDGRASDTFDTLTPTYILAISNSGEVAGARGCFRRLADHDYGRLSLASSEWAARRALIESSRFCADTCAREGRGAGSVTRRERSECLLR